MRTRAITIKAMLNEKENKHFERQVELSGLTKSEFIRQRIRDSDVKARLPYDYYKVYSLVADLTNNIDQIARHANSTGNIDPNKMDAAVLMIEKCWEQIKGLR